MIETERLVLRHWRVADASRLFELASDPLVGPACGWAPHQNVEESRNLIESRFLGKPESYAICLKQDEASKGSPALSGNGVLGSGRSNNGTAMTDSCTFPDGPVVIGSISLKDATENFDIADEGDLEVGYWLGSKYWEHGYASEALDAMVNRAFRDLGRTHLWCGFFEGNERSKHCMEKRGFTFVKSSAGFERPLLGDTATAFFYRLDTNAAVAEV